MFDISYEEVEKILADCGILDFGVMAYSQIPKLIDCHRTHQIPQESKSVIVCVFPYKLSEKEEPDKHNVCHYAYFKDYHAVIGEKLEKAAVLLQNMTSKQEQGRGRFAAFTDISPLPEVFCAEMAGLGFRGRNNLLITKKYGSFVLLGELVTDLAVEIPNTSEREDLKSDCQKCRLCEKSCPASCISQAGVDYEKCISRLTQKKGELTCEEQALIKKGGLVWGCDRCQEVCPHNKNVQTTYIPEFLEDICADINTNNPEKLDELIKTRPYGYKGRALLLRNIDIIEN